MEMWFIFVLASALLTGFQVFTYKVAAERDYDVPLLNVYAGVISAVILFAAAIFAADGYYLSPYVLALAAITAILYMVSNITRHRSLQSIDTAIFFPIYKILGPLLVITAGIIIFAESFTSKEWLGLGLSLLVPLMLISRAEKLRQRNLFRGIILLVVTTVITVLAALASKEMAVQTENIWFLIAVGDLFLAFIAFLIFWRQSQGESIVQRASQHTNRKVMMLSFWMGVLQAFAFALIMFAYQGGPVGIVYTIHSLYILIPIVLSIHIYNEHWNLRKAVAIVLSIAALALLK